MAIGTIVAIGFATQADDATGIEVTRITDDQGDSFYPYFTQPVFHPERESLLVNSNRTGLMQVYELKLRERRMVQITDEPNGVRPHSATFLPTRHAVCYFAENVLKCVNLETHEIAELCRIPDGFHPSVLSPSADGSTVTFAYSEVLETSTCTERIYPDVTEHYFRRPTSVILRVDTTTGATCALWGEDAWITHVNVSPTDDRFVVFCHEGPWHLLQRLWVVRADTLEVYPLLPQRRLLDRQGHEYFSDSGRLFVQWSTRPSATINDWVHYNASIYPDGREPLFFRLPAGMPTHIQTSHHDDSLLVGDCAYPSEDFKDGRDFIGMMRHRDYRVKVVPICRHGTSWRTQASHPHPVFAPDDEWVYFNSDRGGKVNIYRVPIVNIVEGLLGE